MRTVLTLVAGAALLAGALPLQHPALAQDADAPVRVGGRITAPAKTRDVAPVYPPEAQRAGVQGVVVVEIVVGTDGRVTNARVIRSVPLLDEAALAAIRQWEFTPTLLDGKPVPIIMTVSASFAITPGTGAAPARTSAVTTPPAAADATAIRCGEPGDDPARAERLEAAVRFAEEVHERQKRALIERQGGGYVPLADLPDAPAPPDGFNVQLLAEGPRYSLAVQDTRDVCRFAVFTDQSGVIFVASRLRRGEPQPQPIGPAR